MYVKFKNVILINFDFCTYVSDGDDELVKINTNRTKLCIYYLFVRCDCTLFKTKHKHFLFSIYK